MGKQTHRFQHTISTTIIKDGKEKNYQMVLCFDKKKDRTLFENMDRVITLVDTN